MDKKTLKKAINKAKFDPDWFCSAILKSPNDPWQSHGMNAVADLFRIKAGIPTLYNHEGKTRFTAVAFHGCGKTHWIAKMMHWFNFVVRGRIPCTAPKEKQLITRLWPEFRKIKSGAIGEYQQILCVETKNIYWAGDKDHVAIIEAASTPENLAGYHDEYLMFLVEEASGVNEEMFPVIEGALTGDNDSGLNILILIGNPTKCEGEFYNSHMKKGTKELYYQIKIRHEDTKRISKEWVEGMIAKYGKDSPVVQVRVFGNFVKAGKNQLIHMDWLEDAMGKPLPEQGMFHRVRITVDVADGGTNESTITVAFIYDDVINLKKTYRFSFPSALSHKLLFDAVEKIASLYDYDIRRGDDIVVDSLGVGSGTAGLLITSKRYNVILYKGGEQADDPNMYRCKRVQSYIGMRNDYRDGKVYIDDDFCTSQDWDDFTAQMTSIKTRNDSEKLEDLEPKKFLLISPDMADGNAMMYATTAPILGDVAMPELIGNMQSNYDMGMT